MSFPINADIITVAGLELSLLGLLACALYRDDKLPIFRGLQWVQRIRRSRLVPAQPPAADVVEPLLEQAVAESTSHATPRVKRGELTMGLITGGYATVVGAFYAILDSASGLQGWQAALMLLNTLLLGYLFFFSGWWRNAVLLPLNRRVRQDY